MSLLNNTVSLSPLRVSFVGGGTDLPEYYQAFGGMAVGAGIQMYNLVQLISHVKTVNPWRVCTTRSCPPASCHGGSQIMEAVLKNHNIEQSYSAMSYTDLVELGSGLGSSSSLAVATVAAVAHQSGQIPPKNVIAEQAFMAERYVVGSPVGKQDHYMSAYGGLNIYEFHSNGRVDVNPVNMSEKSKLEFENWLSLIRIPRITSANTILNDHSHRLGVSKQAQTAQHLIKKLVEPFISVLENHDFPAAAKILDKVWKEKQNLSNSISRHQINDLYTRAIAAGALGGKLLGAGGGGHMLLITPPDRKQALRQAMNEFELIDITFEHEGVKIIHAS